MAENILESYFIKVTALPDASSFTKLGYVLKDSSKMVENFSVSSIGSIVKMEAAFVGAFAAIGIGLVALADRTAMADQSYRLLGLRMLMTKSSARAMQQALDELGATIDEVAYDPELNKRFRELYAQNIELGKLLGANYDKNMFSIRSLRTEYKKFGTEFETLINRTLSTAFEKLGYSQDEVQQKWKDFNQNFQDSIPQISDDLSNKLVPVWDDVKVVVGDAASMLKTFAGNYSFLIGVVSGDDTIDTTTYSWKNFSKALQDTIDDITKIILSFDLMWKTGSHAFMALTDLALASHYTMPFFWDSGKAEFYGKKAADESVGMAADIRDVFKPENWSKNPDFAAITEYNRAKKFDPTTGKSYAGKPLDESYYNIFTGEAGKVLATGPEFGATGVTGTVDTGHSVLTQMRALAKTVSAQTGIPANLILDQWAHETGGFTSPVFKKHLNAAGIENPDQTYKDYKSLDEFARDYARVITSKRYTSKGILQAHTIEDFAGALKAGNYFTAPLSEYTTGMHRFEDKYAGGGGGDVIIQNQTIVIPPDTSTEEGKKMITEAIQSAMKLQNQKTMSQTAGGPYH